jgi:hypothetical protein
MVFFASELCVASAVGHETAGVVYKREVERERLISGGCVSQAIRRGNRWRFVGLELTMFFWTPSRAASLLQGRNVCARHRY